LPRRSVSQLVLLVSHPLLTVLYLVALRAGHVDPSFAPVVAIGALPLVSAAIGAVNLGAMPAPRPRSGQILLLAVALLEVSLTVLAAAVVGFAIGLRSL
jgi:hypothetical protein